MDLSAGGEPNVWALQPVHASGQRSRRASLRFHPFAPLDATLLTNALPIAAGMLVFHEPFPSGWVGAVRIIAFAAVIGGAFLLSTRTKAVQSRRTRAEPELAVSPTK